MENVPEKISISKILTQTTKAHFTNKGKRIIFVFIFNKFDFI